jgi:hypothetical protein
MRREINGVSFTPHPGWIDQTVVAYSAPIAPGAHTANFVMTREALAGTLRKHADRLIRESAARLDDFELVEEGESTLGGLPSLVFRAIIGTPVALLEQRVMLVELQEGDTRSVVTFTTTAPQDQAAAMRPIFDAMLESLRFGEATPPSDAAIVPIPGTRGH